jgi:ankyrin repeat protein
VDDAVVNVKDPKTGQSAVQIAADLVSWQRRESAKIAHFLIENGALTDLHTAARAGHAQYVALTLAINPRLLNAQDAQGLTPLQRAALIPGSSPECEAVVDLLISVGAKVDLCTAATFGRLDDVKTALAQDPAAVNAPVLGGTPLNWAARPRRHDDDPLAIAKLLLAAGADPAARDAREDGMTPLHHAAEWGAPVALADLFLQQKGVDVNALDDYGWTPLDYAADRNHKEMIAFLTEKGGKLTTTRFGNQPSKTLRFFAAVRDNDAKLVKILLDDTPELANTRGATGETPLHWAAALGNLPIIDLLLAEQAQINAQELNRFGGTPLHWAVRHDQLAAAQHLMEKGADPKAVNQRNGQTLLHTAAQHTYDPALIDLLVSLGIDKTAKDRFGRTARDYADQSNHQNIAGKL